MADKTKKNHWKPAGRELPPPDPCGESRDTEGKLIGRYIYLSEGDEDKLDTILRSLLDTHEKNSSFWITIDLETQGLDYINLEILLYSLSWDGRHSVVWSPHRCPDRNGLLKEVLERIPINNQNIKFDFKWLLSKLGVVPTIFWDTLVSAQLGWAGAFPGNHFALDNLSTQLLKEYKISKDEQKGFIGMPVDAQFRNEQIAYAAADSMITHRLVTRIARRLANQGLLDLWYNVELPLVQSLVRPEVHGVLVDVDAVHEAFDEIKAKLTGLQAKMQAMVEEAIPPEKLPVLVKKNGGQFNPLSYQQIIAVLGAMGIRVASSADDVLMGAISRTDSEFIKILVEYRHLYHGQFKFIKGWINEHVNPTTKCIHPNFKTYGAETGRLSSSDPNMQNIPKHLRHLIIARENKKILTMDYSQYEFRAAAAYTGEQYLIDAFAERAELLPSVKDLAASYGYLDGDAFVKDVTKGLHPPTPKDEKDAAKIAKLVAMTEKLSAGEQDLVVRFGLTDIHRRNAALVLGQQVADIGEAEREVGKCVHIDTEVHTDKGFVQVGSYLPRKRKKGEYYDLKKPLMVMTDEGPREARQIYYNGKAKALKITTRAGRVVVCVPEHRFRSNSRKADYDWVRAAELKPGDELYVKTLKPKWEDIDEKEKALFTLLGMYSASGYKCGYKGKDAVTGFLPSFSEEALELARMLDPKAKPVKFGISSQKVYDEMNRWAGNEAEPILHSAKFRWEFSASRWLAFLRPMIQRGPLGAGIKPANDGIAGKLLNGLTRLGISGFYENGWISFYGEDERLVWQIAQGNRPKYPKELSVREIRARLPGRLQSATFGCFSHEDLAAALGKHKALADRLVDMGLRRDFVVKVEDAGEVETCDLVVPSNHTLVYEGLVSHNTIGYALMYGSGPGTMMETLIKRGFYDATIAKCKGYQQQFMQELPKVARFIEEVHEQVVDPGYLQTFMGRKRFFYLPPRYAHNYRRFLEDCYREAVNFMFQGSNADATKIALVRMEEAFYASFDPEKVPMILLNVHDETVTEADDEVVDRAGEIGERIMIEAGLESVRSLVPIEVSKSIGVKWSK